MFDAFESYADKQNPYENVDVLCNLVAENTELDRSDVLYASNKDAILDGNICYKFTSFIMSHINKSFSISSNGVITLSNHSIFILS